MNQTKKDKKRKTKQKTVERLSPQMVIKIREICPKRWERLWWEGFMEKVSFESGMELKMMMIMVMMMNWLKNRDDSDRDS